MFHRSVYALAVKLHLTVGLFDLGVDLGEKKDVAANPEPVQRLAAVVERTHENLRDDHDAARQEPSADGRGEIAAPFLCIAFRAAGEIPC